MNILTTTNTLTNLNITTIAEIDIDDNNEIIINSSKDGKIIVLTILSHNEENNKIFILSKVGTFYIKEKEIILTDKNISKEFGKNIAVNKFNNDYIIAISDTEYLSSNGKDSVGCVFIYRFISKKGWICVKELTLTDVVDELRFSRFGNILEFVNNDIYIGCIDKYKKFSKDKNQYSNSIVIYKTDNYNHFIKSVLNTGDDWVDVINNTTYVRDNEFYFLYVFKEDLWLASIKPTLREPIRFSLNIEPLHTLPNSIESFDLKGKMVYKDFENHLDGDICNLRVINDFLFITVYEKREFISHMFNVMCLNMNANIFDYLHNTIFHLDRKEDTKSLFYSVDSNDNGIFISTLKTHKDLDLNIIDNLEIVKIKTNRLIKESIYISNVINEKETINSSINVYNRNKKLKVTNDKLFFIEDVVISHGRKKCLLRSKDIT